MTYSSLSVIYLAMTTVHCWFVTRL